MIAEPMIVTQGVDGSNRIMSIVVFTQHDDVRTTDFPKRMVQGPRDVDLM